MKVNIPINLNGRVAVPRSVISLIDKQNLSVSDFGWYLLFVTQTDFGSKYKTYGVITKGDITIAEFIGTDPSTVNKKRKRLIKLGLLKEIDRNTLISNFDLYDGKNKTVVEMTARMVRNGEIETVKEFYKNPNLFLQKQQDYLAERRQKYLQRLEK